MAELLVDFITSLDGYGAAKGWPGFWGLGGPQYFEWLAEESKIDYTFLMGAKTYRIMSAMASDNEGMDELAQSKKVVFSSTLEAPLSWANSELIRGDAVEVVRKMKQEDDKSLSTLGSLSLCRSLLKAGLVDRFRVVVFPVVNGETGYDRIYDGYPELALDLLSSQTFDNSLQLLEYAPRVLDGPPGADAGS